MATSNITAVTTVTRNVTRQSGRLINKPGDTVKKTISSTSARLQGTAVSALNKTVTDAIKSLNLGLTNSQIRTISNVLLSKINKEIYQTTRKTTNGLIKSIPTIAVGNKNPVNLTTGNNGPRKIASTLSNELQKYTNPSLVSDLVSSLKSELVNTLPKNVNLDQLDLTTLIENNNVVGELDSAVSDAVDTELESYLNSLYDINSEATPASIFPSDVSALFEEDDPEGSLEKIQEVYTQSQVSKFLDESQEFLDSTEYTQKNNEKLITLERGFIDPTANYPSSSYENISEVNKLAQGEAAGTVVQKKNYERMIGAKLPGGEAWDQPLSPYKGEYPYNKVIQSESGHIFEVDDTPGAERIHNYHRTGTFEEIDNTGSKVTRIVGTSYTVIDQNGKIYIAGRADVSIAGNCNIYVGNDANIEVDGDTNLTCHNDITAMAGGKMNLSAVEEINMTSKKINMESYEIMNVKSKDQLNMQVDSAFNVKSLGTFSLQSPSIYTYSSNFYNQATGSFHYKGGSSFNVDATAVYFNSGTSQSSKQANAALISNIGILSGRRPFIKVEKLDPSPISFGDKLSLILDEPIPNTPEGEKTLKNARDKAVLTGLVTVDNYDKDPVETERTVISSANEKGVFGDVSLKSRKDLPGNFKLSEHFTVEMLSSKAKVSSYNIVADPSRGLTYGDIVFNLQELALNILEPIYKLYPKMIVTSGYRNPLTSGSSPTSQHTLGKAADIQFIGLPWDEYYDIAIELARVLNFDQMILEYSAVSNNPWIHISYNGSSNRKDQLTFWNHKKYAGGFANLKQITA